MLGEIRYTDDVPSLFGDLVEQEIHDLTASERFSTRKLLIGCSGGASGAACFSKLSEHDLDWPHLGFVFVDERCVDPSSPQANQRTIADALATRLGEVGGFYPMDCGKDPRSYQELLQLLGPIDICQLGMGEDGHTASLFPSSPALDAPTDELVAWNNDITGKNPFERMTLTLSGLSRARLIIITVVGANKGPAFHAVLDGADLPVARVVGPRVIWLVDSLAKAN